MKQLVNYVNAITTNPVIAKKADHNTIILMPQLDTTEGMYRSIIPAYILNQVDGLRLMPMAITERSETISINEKDFIISAKDIALAEHIVFPFVSYPLRNIINVIKEHSPDMFISYYIDFNFYNVHESYPFSDEYNTAERITIIEDNIKVVDQVILTNLSLLDFIIRKFREKYTENFKTNFAYQPLMIFPNIMKAEYKNENSLVKKVLIIGDDYHFTDINFISGILKEFKDKFKNKVDIHILGFDGNRNGRNYLSGLKFKYHKKVSFPEYFQFIHHLAPDCLLIPAKKNSFSNTSKNYIKFLEFAILNIPVIAPDIEPYNKTLVSNNQNGFLAGDKNDYLFQLSTLMDDEYKFNSILDAAYANALDYNITNNDNINIISKIYFPHA